MTLRFGPKSQSFFVKIDDDDDDYDEDDESCQQKWQHNRFTVPSKGNFDNPFPRAT